MRTRYIWMTNVGKWTIFAWVWHDIGFAHLRKTANARLASGLYAG